MDILAFIIGLIAYISVTAWDVWRSLQQPLYSTGEATRHLQDKDGYLDLKKALIFDALFGIAPAVVLTIIFTPYAGGAWFGTVALILFLRLQKAWKNYKKAKQEQFELLALLKRDPLYRPQGLPRQFKNQYIWPTFYDIRVSSDNPITAKEQLFEKLAKLAVKGSGEWWKKDRAKNL